MSWCERLWFPLVWDSLCFLNLNFSFLSQIGKFSAIISSNNFSVPFYLCFSSGTPIMGMLACSMLSQRSLKLSFFKILISFFCSAQVISATLSSSFLCFSVSPNLLLILSSVFLFQLLYSLVPLSSSLYFLTLC